MHLVTFRRNNGIPTAGVLDNQNVFDLSAPYADMLQIITAGETGLAAAREAIAAGPAIPLSEVTILAPIASPPRIFCIGLNYADHAAESQMKVQAVPTVFMKLASSIVGPDETVIIPHNITQPDYEAELAVVIGKPGYRIAADDWQQYVFGYTIVNDVSARDIQLATSQWTLGKSFPTFCPIGPAIVTADEIADPHTLDIALSIDGETLQHSNTRNLIFKLPALIEYISSLTPLEAGDIISTGTPEGVGLGRTPNRWIQPGETMTITIQSIGQLTNPTIAEVKPAEVRS